MEEDFSVHVHMSAHTKFPDVYMSQNLNVNLRTCFDVVCHRVLLSRLSSWLQNLSSSASRQEAAISARSTTHNLERRTTNTAVDTASDPHGNQVHCRTSAAGKREGANCKLRISKLRKKLLVYAYFIEMWMISPSGRNHR